ncbi:MAG TPA: hypothetical protein PLX89_07195 [Verrucomicrobiota bacterium]|nr:hypothetical protein [Verrucomicrobiales bacterium]HRI12776.1 hypothetical protein [Verrucomicrobiota bacterium]
MGNLPAFLESNWFNVVQSVGIVASLVFTAITIRRDSKSHRMTALLALEEQHRELWSELHRRPELGRILSAEVDLVANPITTAEKEFLNTVFVHFCIGWRLAKEHKVLSVEDLRRDLWDFVLKPIPSQVWHETKNTRERAFVRFAAEALANGDRKRG